MKKLSWRQSLVGIAFLLSLCVTIVFVVRAVRPVIYWHYHHDEPIRGWMTMGYVAHSYHVPPHVLHQNLGLPDKPPDKRPLREIAKAQNRSIDDIRTLLLAAIAQARQPSSASTSRPPNPDGTGLSITDQLLGAVLLYGLPILFAVILIASVGVPFPISLTLVAAGSFVKQGEMKLAPVIIAASLGAILGDQIGYGLSRWGGRSLIDRITSQLGGAAKIKRAEAVSRKWGGSGIFFSRWLVTALGPWLNFTSGMARYPWRRFFAWAAPGEVLWVVLYVTLGYIFSDRVQYIAEILGNLGWAILALIVAIILGWRVFRYLRPERYPVETQTTEVAIRIEL